LPEVDLHAAIFGIGNVATYFDADDCVVVVIALVLYIRLLPGLIVYRVCFEVSIPVACGLT